MFDTLIKVALLPVAMALDVVVIPITGGDKSCTADIVKSIK